MVFNTPGANANAVAELVMAGMLLASRNIIGGIAWAQSLQGQGAEVPKLVEKGKGQFVGPELRGKTLGVIGLGAIGAIVPHGRPRLGHEGCRLRSVYFRGQRLESLLPGTSRRKPGRSTGAGRLPDRAYSP